MWVWRRLAGCRVAEHERRQPELAYRAHVVVGVAPQRCLGCRAPCVDEDVYPAVVAALVLPLDDVCVEGHGRGGAREQRPCGREDVFAQAGVARCVG